MNVAKVKLPDMGAAEAALPGSPVTSNGKVIGKILGREGDIVTIEIDPHAAGSFFSPELDISITVT